MQKIIAGRNAKILTNEEKPLRTCSCRKNTPCPLEGKCLEKNLIYNATVTQEDGTQNNYIGNTSTDFKSRLAVHRQSFKSSSLNQTSLSKHMHELKKQKIEFNLTWKIIDRGSPFSPVSNQCNLCTNEKFHILFSPELAQLNSRNKIYSNCRHKQSVLLVPKVRKKKTSPG